MILVLYCLHLLWSDRLPYEWVASVRRLVMWLIVSGSGANVGSAFLSYSMAAAYAEKLAEANVVPVDSIMINDTPIRETQTKSSSAGETQTPGRLVVTRNPDGTLATTYVAQTPSVKHWETR